FDWTIEDNGSRAVLEGSLTEMTDLRELAAQLPGQSVRLDLSKIARINSQGTLRWLHFMDALVGKSIVLERCSPAVVEQLNCLKSFTGSARIASILVPYRCDRCDLTFVCELEAAAVKSTQDL